MVRKIMFFNVKAPIWLISLLETLSIYICLLGVKVGKVTVQPVTWKNWKLKVFIYIYNMIC